MQPIADATEGTRLLAELMAGSSSMLVFTGAGISTASGIPDYRGPQGVWKTRQPVYYQDFMRSEEARVRYWTQKLEDREAFGRAAPTATHHALVELERAGRLLLLVTQNVDGLHKVAGSTKVVELHGTNREVECQQCLARSDPEPHFEAFAATGEAPECECGGVLKPATISFGQALRPGDLDAAFAAAETCDLVISLGSTLSVTPAANVPLAASRRVPYAVVNRGATDHDAVPTLALRIEGDVDAIVPAAVAAALA